MDQTKRVCAHSADDLPDGESPGLPRAATRTNIFVVAALSSSEGSGPVHIRNMSPGGALVEGPVIPPQGSRLRLSRGSLSVSGEIVWQRENRAGLRFDAEISVPDWLPAGVRAVEQQRIDEIVHIHKTGVAAANLSSTPFPAPVGGEVLGQFLSIGAALASAADDLASDTATVAKHPRALQLLDASAALVETLIGLLPPPPRSP